MPKYSPHEATAEINESLDMLREMQSLMHSLRKLGERALCESAENCAKLDDEARPLIKRYTELQQLIPSSRKIRALRAGALQIDAKYGYLT